MEISIDRYDDLASRGAIKQFGWGDGISRACLMSALVAGAKSEDDCAAKGWPLWLVEMAGWLFESYPPADAVERGRALAVAISDAEARGVDWGGVYRRVRLDAVLPIAMKKVGNGDEPWRVKCRAILQLSMDSGGKAVETAEAIADAVVAGVDGRAWAAGVEWVPGATAVAWAAEAAGDTWTAGAAGAVGAVWAGGVSKIAGEEEVKARDRIESALIAAMSAAH